MKKKTVSVIPYVLTCAVCRASEKPGFIAFELGFVAGAKTVTRGSIRDFVATLCEPHAASLAGVLARRVKR